MTEGTVLSGRYAVGEIVGTGGMAVVYRGWDREKKRTVALKVLRPEYENDAEFLRRFSREAEAASKVSHPNIVQTFDVGKDGDLRYIVMEYVEGTTLKDMIRQMGHLNYDAVVRMGIRILAAVDHAHRNGIVHRDIKPQNILVDTVGTVKVADFGIARLKAQQTTRIAETTSSALGSVHYISPEQAQGAVADEASDLYSVGVVLYEMLSGRVPFDGETAVSVALKHVNEAPTSLRQIDPSIPKAIDEVVLRALRKDPKDRYRTAADMARDLRRAMEQPEGGFVRPPRGSHDSGRGRDRGSEAKPADLRNRRLRRRRQRRTTFYSLLIMVLIALILTGAWYVTRVKVPYVTGMTGEEAYRALSSSFDVRIRQEYSGFVPEGVVISQDPEEGTYVRRHAAVELSVSEGPREVEVTDLRGMPSEDAMRYLVDQGIPDVHLDLVADETMPVGTVTAQEPPAGFVDRSSSVTLLVSGETVSVPDLFGMTPEEADRLLTDRGLTTGETRYESEADAKEGTVIRQSADPETRMLLGGSVDLTIAASPQTIYWPIAELRVVVPLNNTRVSIMMTAPSGEETVFWEGVLDAGTCSIPLSSAESGLHRVEICMDDITREILEIDFE